MKNAFTFLEFFAGGGMARLGLGESWRCLFANDIDSQKCAAYRTNFGGEELVEGDIAELTLDRLPGEAADLMWGSFPCQDLSLAGARGGITAKRSGLFFSFWELAQKLVSAGRAPKIIAVENVAGLLTSKGGRDFAAIVESMTGAGYNVAALAIDAKKFIPQSRPRLFVLAFSEGACPPITNAPHSNGAPPALLNALKHLSPEARRRWLWIDKLPTAQRNTHFSDIVEWDAAIWHSRKQTKALLDMMSAPQRRHLDMLINQDTQCVGAAFRRMRMENGETVQRLEARFDGLAGCLRTPAGGSSRQIILVIENGVVRSRLMTPREAARLMGLPEEYQLPKSATSALKLCGDGVCVPVVQWLAENIFEKALKPSRQTQAA